jgi:hypothetical protein
VSDSNKNAVCLASSISLPGVTAPERWANGNSKLAPPRKEGWPDFPFFWIEKPDMSSLQEIASRLKEKVDSSRRSGFIGETTPMEKQIIEHLIGLEQQTAELHDAVQAALQIIDNDRLSQRAKRARKWILEKANGYWHTLEKSMPYRVLALVGVSLTVWAIVNFAIHRLHLLR